MNTDNNNLEERLLRIEDGQQRIERLLILSTKTVFNTEEAAIFLGVKPDRVRELCRQNVLPFYKQGRQKFLKKSELEDLMTQRRIPTNEELMRDPQKYGYQLMEAYR